jgi:hypothetical protein
MTDFAGGDARLDLAGLACSEGGVHAGPDGGDHAIQFLFEPPFVEARPGDVGRFGVIVLLCVVRGRR